MEITLSRVHARLVALEFCVTHLLADLAMQANDPVGAARTLKQAANAHAFALLKLASDERQNTVAIEIGGALSTLTVMVAAEVGRRAANDR